MKVNDAYPVRMEGLEVAAAVIEDIDRDAGEVTFYIPATRFVVGIAESIVDKNPEGTSQLLTDSGLEEPAPVTSRANAPEKPQEPVSAPPVPKVETAAEREIREAYNGSTSLADMQLDSSKLDD